MIKLICCDLDGTLLNAKKEITKENKEAIKRFRSLGGHFVLATGRPLNGVKRIIDELDLNDVTDTTLTYNGGVIMENVSKRVLAKTCIKGSLVKELYYESKRLGTYFHFFSEDNTLYTTEPNEYTKVEETINQIHAITIDINEVLDDALFIKAMMVASKEVLDSIRDKIDPKFSFLEITRSSKIFLEFHSKEISKGKGLLFLKDYYGLKDNETMAIGDEENDLSMIKASFMGVAMANARDSVKEAAKFITLDNESSGVAYAIEKLILEKNKTAE